MKRILLSLGMIVFVGGVVVGATGAFFSDTETSTGNTFAAGAIDLTVDSEQHYNGMVCVQGQTGGYVWQYENPAPNPLPTYPVLGSPCDGTWSLTDLQNGVQKFFNFSDVKPGDSGENTISLHVDSNDAYACVDVNITKNDDVTCTDPENDAEGPTVCQNSVPSADFDGELAQNLNFFAWVDSGITPGFQGQDEGEGDNIWQANELPLFSNIIGSASDALDGEHYTLAAPPLAPLPAGGNTNYIGLAWCAGTLTTTGGNPPLVCDGTGMGNDVQTDNLIASIAFRVEQSRNNPNFTCTPRQE